MARTPERHRRLSRSAFAPLRAGSAGRRVRRLLVAVLVILAAAPETARAVAPITQFPINAPDTVTGMCFHDGDLYAVDKANILIRYDPATGEMLEVVSPMLPDLPDAHIHGMAASGDTFWVGDTVSWKIYELRFSDYEVVRSVNAPPGNVPYGLTFHDGLLWCGQHSDGPPTPINAIDPVTGEIVATIECGAADVHGLAWVGGYLWVLDDGHSNEIDQVDVTGQVHNTFWIAYGYWLSFAYDGASFWTSNREMFYIVDLPVPPPGDLDGDGTVGIFDFLELLGQWGPCDGPCPPRCPADLGGDCSVGITDLLSLLANWG
jgi:hypothetical protein